MSDRRPFPARKGIATLVARDHLTPRMLRLTLEAEDFGPGWPGEQPGEILTLLFAEPGRDIVLPTSGWSFPPEAAEQPWRNYTVRAHDRAARRIVVDVVLHRPQGPACAWAQAAPLGGAVGYAGPRVDFAPQPDARWLLLCGDETALPAIASIIERASVPVLAVVEVHDAEEQLPLPVTWVHRAGAPAATTSHLADALRALALPDGPGQAWGAAESLVARDVRAVLREERGLPAARVKATGYWRRED